MNGKKAPAFKHVRCAHFASTKADRLRLTGDELPTSYLKTSDLFLLQPSYFRLLNLPLSSVQRFRKVIEHYRYLQSFFYRLMIR